MTNVRFSLTKFTVPFVNQTHDHYQMKRRITHKILRLMVLFLMPLVVCGSSVEQTEQLFYYTFDKRVPIEKVPGKIMIKKKQDLSKGGLEDISSSSKLVIPIES